MSRAGAKAEVIRRLSELRKSDGTPAFTEVFDHVPETIASTGRNLPVATLGIAIGEQADLYTGPAVEAAYEWTLTLYIDLRDYEQAHSTLEELFPLVLGIIRPDPRLRDPGSTLENVDRSQIRDSGEEPDYDSEAGVVTKTFRVRIELEET